MPRVQRRRALRAVGWLALTRLLLWATPRSTALRWLDLDRPEATDPGCDREVVDSWRRAVDVAARNAWPWPAASCLPRALVLQRLLRSDGCEARLRIGVRRSPDGGTGSEALAAHAWVEWRGMPIGEPDDIRSRFTALESADAIDLELG